MDVEARLVELETRLAYQDDTVLALNRVVSEQQKQLDQLENTVKRVVERLRQIVTSDETADPTANEKPPHY